jgi:hypothetical protein
MAKLMLVEINMNYHTRKYLKKQPLWHDRDLVIAALFGGVLSAIMILGFLL